MGKITVVDDSVTKHSFRNACAVARQQSDVLQPVFVR